MKKLAKMAMLDENDVKNALPDIEKILPAAEILKEVDMTEVPMRGEGALREDEEEPTFFEGGYIVVPKVVGE